MLQLLRIRAQKTAMQQQQKMQRYLDLQCFRISEVVVAFQIKENFTLVIFTLLVNIINQLSMPVNTLKISQQSKCGPKGERNHASSRDAKGIGQTVIDPPDEMKTKRLLRRHCCYESRSDGIGKPQTLILFSQSLPSKLVYWMKGTFHTNHNN